MQHLKQRLTLRRRNCLGRLEFAFLIRSFRSRVHSSARFRSCSQSLASAFHCQRWRCWIGMKRGDRPSSADKTDWTRTQTETGCGSGGKKYCYIYCDRCRCKQLQYRWSVLFGQNCVTTWWTTSKNWRNMGAKFASFLSCPVRLDLCWNLWPSASHSFSTSTRKPFSVR